MGDFKIRVRTSRILNFFLLSLLLILVRVWYLSVIAHDEQIVQSRKPQRRTVIEKIDRATIRDRFNLPLAINQIQYDAAVCYAHIRQIPSIQRKKDPSGKLVKFFARKEYIQQLAKLLAKELNMDALEIEDIIHGKASLFPHTPFILKENISEWEYSRLKMLEREWLGIQTQRSSKRIYPQGKVASNILGYMGLINQEEYLKIAQETSTLQAYLNMREEGEIALLPKGFDSPLAVRKRLKELQEKAYAINDWVGKSGLESAFDETLRGTYGKKLFEVDIKGNFLRELPGSQPPFAGQRLILTISSELQKKAEELLTKYESQQDERDSSKNTERRRPWQRGGAIVVLEPYTGEILTLASYPRFDPNDFTYSRIKKTDPSRSSSIARWLESQIHIGDIWDGKDYLEKELFSQRDKEFYQESQSLDWERFIDVVLSTHCQCREVLHSISSLKMAIEIQEHLQVFLEFSGQSNIATLIDALYENPDHVPSRHKVNEEIRLAIQENLELHAASLLPHKKVLDRFLSTIHHNDDKLLLLDLIRLVANKEDFPDELLEVVGKQTFASYRELSQALNQHLYLIKACLRESFHRIDFKQWRENHFKGYLHEMRAQEKRLHHYTRPYTDYLELKEKKLFQEFWDKSRFALLDAFILGRIRPEYASLYPHLTPYFSYILQLKGQLSENDTFNALKELISSLDINLSPLFLKSLRSFQDLARPLLGKYPNIHHANEQQTEKDLASAFYPSQGFGYGRSFAFRQSAPLGSVFKLVVAYQALIERYEKLKAQHQKIDLNFFTILDEVKWAPKWQDQIVGYFESGEPIKRLYKGGCLPRSSHYMGKIDLMGAIEQSSNVYFSILASDYIEDPTSIAKTAALFGFGEKTGIELPGEYPGKIPDDLKQNNSGIYSFAIGQHSLVVTPLQTSAMIASIVNGGNLVRPHIIKLTAGKKAASEEDFIFPNSNYPYQNQFALIGINFPLFTQTLSLQMPDIHYKESNIKQNIPLPQPVQDYLLQAMHLVTNGSKGNARPELFRFARFDPETVKNYQELHSQMSGKTGTAEILYKQTLDAETPPSMEKHTWFAGAYFSDSECTQPEIVIAVYLRFADAGKYGAPLAASMAQHWKEICEKHGQ